MNCLLDAIVHSLPVAHVPEVIIHDFLLGDDCLDDTTIAQVFAKKYTHDGLTYLDPAFTVRHSFDDQPMYNESAHVWYRNGKIHREKDQPAMITNDGSLYWLINGRFHRENGNPAIILEDGRKSWYNNGKIYRYESSEKTYTFTLDE